MAAEHMISVNIFRELNEVALDYSEAAFNALASGTLKIYFAAVSVWWTYSVIQFARGKGDLNAIMEYLFVVVCVSTVLLIFNQSGFSVFYDGFYVPIHTLTTAVSDALLTARQRAGGGIQGDSILDLLWILEREIDKLIEFQKAMSGVISWYNITAHLMLFVVLIPYLFVWLIFLAYVLNYIFKITAITVMGPVMVALFTFPVLRKYAYAMGKIVLSGALTLIFASVAMGFTLHLFHTYMGLLPVNEGGALQAQQVNEFIFSTQFMTLFVFGGVSVLFHLKAPVLARAISGVADGPGAEAFVAGVGATLLASSKRGVSRSTSRALASASEMGGRASTSVAQTVKGWFDSQDRIDPTK